MAKTWRQGTLTHSEPAPGEWRVPLAREIQVPTASGTLFDLARPSSQPLIGAEKAAPTAPWAALRAQHDKNPADSGKVTEIDHRRIDSCEIIA
jgi:hypothetical protein